MICPDCNGNASIVASHVRYADGSGASNVPMKCSRCNATGECPDEMAEWIRVGERMRQARLAVYRNLHQEATRRGMTAVELSKMEHGKIKPIPAEETTP